MDANIYKENGTLIIDFRNPQSNCLHRDVEIETSGADTIHVTAKRANFVYADRYLMGSGFDRFSKANIDKVLPEYVFDYDASKSPWYERPVFEVFKKPNIYRQVKRGYVELKDTNHPVSITTTKYTIYHK